MTICGFFIGARGVADPSDLLQNGAEAHQNVGALDGLIVDQEAPIDRVDDRRRITIELRDIDEHVEQTSRSSIAH